MNFHLYDKQRVTIEVENKRTKLKVTFDYIIESTVRYDLIIRNARKIIKGYFPQPKWKIKSITITT